MCIRISLVPVGEENVVLDVGRGDVGNIVAETLDFGFYFGRKSDWGEDCKGSRAKAD